MPRLRIPMDIYERAKTISGRDGTAFRAWARSKALKYNGGAISCVCKRDASVVVQIDVDLPADVVRSAIVAAVQGVTLAGGDWSKSTIDAVIYAERFWGRECSPERAVEMLNKRLQERVSYLSSENKKTHQRGRVI